MAITTPALSVMNTFELLPEAYAFADGVLQSEGIDPLHAFVDTEVQRHHYAVALRMHSDITRLQTLASVAFFDKHFKSNMLEEASATDDERHIARDLEAKNDKMHCRIPDVCQYIVELRQFEGTK